MKLLVTDDHLSEENFSVFFKCSIVENIESMEGYLHWLACKIEGQNTFAPNIYMINGKLKVDYNPTGLVLKKEILLNCRKLSMSSLFGCFPASKLISIKNSKYENRKS
ncbi:MAG: hypothetical protein GX638_11565 [Crenarchaeota archaeon]|nr:hypothetical protein [Thermoproteota archaeon]